MTSIDAAILKLTDLRPDKVEQAQHDPRVVGWFVGRAMTLLRGKANPELVNTRVKILLHLVVPPDNSAVSS